MSQLLPTISRAYPGGDLGKLLVEPGVHTLLHFRQIQSSTALWGSGRGGFSKDAAAAGFLHESVSGCGCLHFAIPVGLSRACCVHCVHNGFP